MFSKHRQQSTGMPAGTSCLWTALSTPEFFTGRWAKSPKGCGPQTAIGRAPVEQAGRLCPQPDWAGRHLFPWAMRVSGVPDVSVAVTFHSGQVGNCLLKTSICIVSSQPWGQKKKWHFLFGCRTMPFRHHFFFPFHCEVLAGFCLLLLVTYRGGTGHTTGALVTSHSTLWWPRGPFLSPEAFLWTISPCLHCRTMQLRTLEVLSTPVRGRPAIWKGATQTFSVGVHVHLATEVRWKPANLANSAEFKLSLKIPFILHEVWWASFYYTVLSLN